MPRPDPGFDLGAAERWMAAHVPGFRGPATVTKFDTGQSNPTFLLVTPSGRYVLRRKPPGALLKSAHAVDREFRVQSALAESDVPVAGMLALCDDRDVIGSEFYVMEHVEGRNFDDPRLPECSRDERVRIMQEMVRVLAAIHAVDIEAVGLSDYGPRGNYYRRQIDRWTKQYRASETEVIADMDDLIDWLDQNVPPDDGRVTLVHGDYRIDNMLFGSDSTRCLAVLDWELSTLGHPYADLAAVVMQWHRPTGALGRGLAGVDRMSLGLPEDRAFVEEYCRLAQVSGIGDFGFYLAFCNFRMAGILQGVKRRALDGNASNPERALKIGEHVPAFASAGLEAAKAGMTI